MNYQKRISSINVSALALLITLVFSAAPAALAQGISEAEYEKRQQGLLDAIAAMEAAEAKATSSTTALEAELEKNAPNIAAREKTITESAGLAVPSPTITKAEKSIAAREARAKVGAPPEVAAMLDAPPVTAVVQGGGPKPGAKPVPQAELDAEKKGQPKEVEILAESGCTFDSKANLVVFEKDVVVNHPQFDLVCDKLIVFLKKKAAEGESAMDKAIATGKRVTIRQVDDKGEVQIGQARKVTFRGMSGDVILEDWPQVQTGTKLVQAKAQSTVIILNQNGKMKIDGPSITTLVLPNDKPK